MAKKPAQTNTENSPANEPEKKNENNNEDSAPKEKVAALALSAKGFAPQTIEEGWRYATALSRSNLVPDTYRNKPDDCLIAIDLSFQWGISPLAVMQHLYMVNGRPALDAALSTALVNRSNIFVDPIEYEVEGKDAKNKGYRVRAYATRKSTGKTLYGPWIDWDVVTGEGWDKKTGSKWKTMPEQMFHYRAATWFQRRYCPEITMGMLTTDEAEDIPARYVESFETTQEKTAKQIEAEAGSVPVTEQPEPQQEESQQETPEQTQPEPQEPQEQFSYHCNKCGHDFNEPVAGAGNKPLCPAKGCLSAKVVENKPEFMKEEEAAA